MNKKLLIIALLLVLALLFHNRKEFLDWYHLTFRCEIEYYENDEIKVIACKKNGLVEVVESYSDGNIKQIYYLDFSNRLQGRYTEFYRSGQPMKVYHYLDGEKDSIAIGYSENGLREIEEVYVGDSVKSRVIYHYDTLDSIDYIERFDFN